MCASAMTEPRNKPQSTPAMQWLVLWTNSSMMIIYEIWQHGKMKIFLNLTG